MMECHGRDGKVIRGVAAFACLSLTFVNVLQLLMGVHCNYRVARSGQRIDQLIAAMIRTKER